MTVSANPAISDRSGALDYSAFHRIAGIAEREAGLAIPEAKRSMVQSRLSRRLKATGLQRFEDYVRFVESSSGVDERTHMISALTTNVSHFFREEHHFARLRELLIGLQDNPSRGRRLRVWSAGCSTGQEPYSIAMTIADTLADLSDWDVRILATDIDQNVLETARAARFSASEIDVIDRNMQRSYLHADGTHVGITKDIRDLIAFRALNLVSDWPMSGPFDVIFCRNVLIYFSEDTQSKLWPRFRGLLRPGALLFLGHSERIHDPVKQGFSVEGVTTYRRLT